MEIRNRDFGNVIVTEHKHENFDYWHPPTRVHIMEEEEMVALPDNEMRIEGICPFCGNEEKMVLRLFEDGTGFQYCYNCQWSKDV